MSGSPCATASDRGGRETDHPAKAGFAARDKESVVDLAARGVESQRRKSLSKAKTPS